MVRVVSHMQKKLTVDVFFHQLFFELQKGCDDESALTQPADLFTESNGLFVTVLLPLTDTLHSSGAVSLLKSKPVTECDPG